MSYSSVDAVIWAWAHRHGLKLPTRDDHGVELNFRNTYTSSHEAECCQIWIDPPQNGLVVLHAATVESRDDEEVTKDWCVPVQELDAALEVALLFARTWMTRQS